MFSLCWEIEELKKLTDELRKLRPTIGSIIGRLSTSDFFMQEQNLPRILSDLRERLVFLVKGIARFRRTAATHLFVVMISSELRNKKPYALPIQCLPYAGLKESDIRTVVVNVVKEMKSRRMKVRGKLLAIIHLFHQQIFNDCRICQ